MSTRTVRKTDNTPVTHQLNTCGNPFERRSDVKVVETSYGKLYIIIDENC
jgi:hypothetical protein